MSDGAERIAKTTLGEDRLGRVAGAVLYEDGDIALTLSNPNEDPFMNEETGITLEDPQMEALKEFRAEHLDGVDTEDERWWAVFHEEQVEQGLPLIDRVQAETAIDAVQEAVEKEGKWPRPRLAEGEKFIVWPSIDPDDSMSVQYIPSEKAAPGL